MLDTRLDLPAPSGADKFIIKPCSALFNTFIIASWASALENSCRFFFAGFSGCCA